MRIEKSRKPLFKIKGYKVLEADAIKFFLVAIGTLFISIVAPVGSYTNQKPTIKKEFGAVIQEWNCSCRNARIEYSRLFLKR